MLKKLQLDILEFQYQPQNSVELRAEIMYIICIFNKTTNVSRQISSH